MRKLFFTGLLALAGLWVLSRVTHVGSYTSVLWTQVKHETQTAIPTQFELARMRGEIHNLDGDISRLCTPIAENMADVNRLRKEIDSTRTNLDQQKQTLLTMTADLEGNPKLVSYGGKEYPAQTIRTKLQRDFTAYKTLELTLTSKEALLQAKEQMLDRVRDQLVKLQTKKREYEVRLARLEAEEETLKVAKMGTNLEIDNSRATTIESGLKVIEHRQEVERNRIILSTGQGTTDAIPVGQAPTQEPDLNTIRSHLNQQRQAVTVTNPTKATMPGSE